jgi:hypothetical protein
MFENTFMATLMEMLSFSAFEAMFQAVIPALMKDLFQQVFDILGFP